MQPKHELSQIVHQYANNFYASHPQGYQVKRTLQAISQCRTGALGGHSSGCKDCGTISYHFNSCRNRHCPKCQAVSRERWMLQRERELLPVAYFHVVFTLPHELNALAKKYPKEVYSSLFRASWETIKELSHDPKYLGGKTGMVALLHTWGQQLWLHPHLHCIVPGGGITASGKWKQSKNKGKYLYPTFVISKVFRGKYMAELRASGVIIPQYIAKVIMKKKWVVYAKRPFGSPKMVVEYLGRYTHKIAISNHRLQSIKNGEITFSYKDYNESAKQKRMTLKAAEFLRRFSLHILPSGFVRIRHYGILASRNKRKELNIAKSHFKMEPWDVLKIDWIEIAETRLGIKLGSCKDCGGELEVIKIIHPKRGPPIVGYKNMRGLQQANNIN